MNSGDLRHKIMIKYNAARDQTDDSGNPLEDWQTLMTTYAKRTGLKGKLFYQAAAAQAETDILFTLRYRCGIKAGMKVIHGADSFEIKVPPVDPTGRRRWLELHTRQVLQNGG